MLERRHDLLEELRREVVALGQRARARRAPSPSWRTRSTSARRPYSERRDRRMARHGSPECLVAWWPFRRFEHPCEMDVALCYHRRRWSTTSPASCPATSRTRRTSSSRARLRPQIAGRIHRPAGGQGQPVGPAPGREGQGRGGRPHPALRPARPRQDDPRDDRRPRARGQRPLHLGPGHRAGRRPRRDPDLARRARRPVHRRGPPPQPRGRGDPLSRRWRTTRST